MTGSTPSSVSRYRPAVLVLTGAAAAYAAYLIYSSLQDPHTEGGLHRSNAVRRPNPRGRRGTARTVARLQQNAPPLGEFDFFGVAVEFDARNVIPPEQLRDIARQSQPSATSEMVESRIGQLYDAFFDRLLALTFPSRALSPNEEEAVIRWLSPQITDETMLVGALQRHSHRFSSRNADAVDNAVETESIVCPTELSWSDDLSEDNGFDTDGQTLQRTLYHIAEDRARQEGVIHRGITCNGCDTKPIRGVRWRCANCADFDLCSDCEATNSHIKTHVFYKIKVPAPYLGLPKQDPVYPGRPHLMNPSISSSLKKRLLSKTKMEAEELEALWDQFTCLAGTEWESDPNEIGWALDRRAFNQAFIPRYSTFVSAPNLIFDRIFAYYDSDHNGLIGFEEFINGLDGMHSRNPKIKNRIVFNGYDVDGDGYISRKDVLRIFRAYYAIEKDATRNYLAVASEELSVRGALETIHSSQPLGSAFTQSSIPEGDSSSGRLREKLSAEPGSAPPVVYDDTDDTFDRARILMDTENEELSSAQAVAFVDDEDQIVRDRWARRHFYVDEEEGLRQPEGFEEPLPISESLEQTDEQDDSPPTPEQQRPRESRSSSRVRFQDDVDFETRSNASTSSRPIGERWGGYEIPEPEKDLGKEVLYQITQQAFNELLDPLFREKEDNAMDAFATRVERRKLAASIERAEEWFRGNKANNELLVYYGVFTYSRFVLDVIAKMRTRRELLEDMKNSKKNRVTIEEELYGIFDRAEQELAKIPVEWPAGSTPHVLDLWNAHLCRLQLRHEWRQAILDLGSRLGWLTPLPSGEVCKDPSLDECRILYRDPTMPQFRPNSAIDIKTSVSHEKTTKREPNEESVDSGSSSLGVDKPEYEGDTRYGPPPGPFFIRDAHTISISKVDDGIEEKEEARPASISIRCPTCLRRGEAVWVSLGQNCPVCGTASENGVPVLQDMRTLPRPMRDRGSPSQRTRPSALSEYNNHPRLLSLWIDEGDMSLQIHDHPVSHNMPWERDSAYKAFERKLRLEALKKSSPLHVALLASLEVVDAEISERKGSGLLSYAEFEEKMEEGNLRFLEAWMEWVSF